MNVYTNAVCNTNSVLWGVTISETTSAKIYHKARKHPHLVTSLPFPKSRPHEAARETSIESTSNEIGALRPFSQARNRHGQIKTPFYPSIQQTGDYYHRNHGVSRSPWCYPLPSVETPPLATAWPQGTRNTKTYPVARREAAQQSGMATLASRSTVQGRSTVS